MHALTHKHRNTHQAFAYGTLLVYALVTWAIPLLHDDDCSTTHGIPSPGTSLPCGHSCPACKFLAGSHATESPCNSGVIATLAETTSEAPRDCWIVITHFYMGSIILRGPPIPSFA